MLGRMLYDRGYLLLKPALFLLTHKNPEVAHDMFIYHANNIHNRGLEDFLLEFPGNHEKLKSTQNGATSAFSISNAAGLNKNGDIPPQYLSALGFDRVVIGTVTADRWSGNPQPRIKRFPRTKSVVNWMGLPGVGAKQVDRNLEVFGEHGVPITINFMSTPGKEGRALYSDLEDTMLATRNNPYVDRFELNISCPNTHSGSGEMDARELYLHQLESMLTTVQPLLLRHQTLYLKVSPDLENEDIESIVEIASRYKIEGFTTTNTTTEHSKPFIKRSPGKGGASGRAVYDKSALIQFKFKQLKREDQKLIGCGGIDEIRLVEDRLEQGADELQFFTPLIFYGPKLLRDIRTHKYSLTL